MLRLGLGLQGPQTRMGVPEGDERDVKAYVKGRT